jgi:hypothetical protein
MIKYIITAAFLLVAATNYAQRADTTILGIYSTGARFNLTRAAFGNQGAINLLSDMVIAYDTVDVATTKTDTGRIARVRHTYEKRCNMISEIVRNKNIYKDKIVLMDLNPSCDFTQVCLLAQRSGAKAFIFVHNSNSNGNIKLPKSGQYPDSIKVPIFVVGNEKGEQIRALLPSKAGILTKTQSLQNVVSNNVTLDLNAIAEYDKSLITWVNNTGTANDFFVVQRLNPITGVWEDMQIVNTHQAEGYENYTTYDPNPKDGENTYRIKLVLNDGTIRYSEPKTVMFYSSNGITLFPNPADDLLNIAFKGYLGQEVDITLFDMHGKRILIKHIEKLQSETHTLDISNQTVVGQYLILIQSQGKRDVVRPFTVGK